MTFLEDQVNAAELNEFKLQMRYDELVDEINQIKEEMDTEKNSQKSARADESANQDRRKFYDNQIADNLEGAAYFKLVSDNFSAYGNYLKRKNDRLRDANSRKPGGSLKTSGLNGMIKESQEEIVELSAPFKKLFEGAIEKTKEDIAQRNLKTKFKNNKGNLNAQQNS